MAQNRHICYYWQVNDNKTVIITLPDIQKVKRRHGRFKNDPKRNIWQKQTHKKKNILDEINGRLLGISFLMSCSQYFIFIHFS